ncbi:MAG: FlxA-like family protein [Ruminococcus sp.]|nr:FlxA-like family protein [Ruminococcus sp.]
MNVSSINQTSGNLSVSQSTKQDSHEKSIEQQILTLQEKMRNITYDNEMPDEEKSNEKKSLQEKIQTLNSELKQYQIQKRQEEAEKRQQETKKREEEVQRQQEQAARAEQSKAQKAAVSSDVSDISVSESSTAAVSSLSSDSVSASVSDAAGTLQSSETSAEAAAVMGFSDAESDAMISFSNTKEHLESMQKLYTSLEGQMRTAQTDAEKADIQKKIDNVSKSMGEKIQKIADTITDTRKEDEARRKKVREKLQESREKRERINAVVSNSSQNDTIDYGYWQKNAATLGKVLITRKK